MLANVKFFKIFIVFILLSANLSANEKDQIVTQLNNLNSLEFTFDQVVNDKIEKGSCLLEFPGKLKCNYFDDKHKESQLIIMLIHWLLLYSIQLMMVVLVDFFSGLFSDDHKDTDQNH